MISSKKTYGTDMFSIELYPNPYENPEIVKLVFYSMKNKYTSECNSDGLTFKEVKSIISKHPVHVIKVNGKIVGILNTSTVDPHLKMRLQLDSDFSYINFGMIYIDKKERSKGYASQALEHTLKNNKNLIYIVHQSNTASNKLAAKHMPFFKKYSSFRSFEPYNIYKIEQ